MMKEYKLSTRSPPILPPLVVLVASTVVARASGGQVQQPLASTCYQLIGNQKGAGRLLTPEPLGGEHSLRLREPRAEPPVGQRALERKAPLTQRHALR